MTFKSLSLDDSVPGTLAYLGLGGNIGDSQAAIEYAVAELNAHPDIHVLSVSSMYETEPVGYLEQPPFVNAAVSLITEKQPHDLLQTILGIETSLGRERTVVWGPRVIDIDILIFGTEIIAAEHLTVPHPRMAERRFVLEPLAEIAPQLVIPGQKHSVSDALASLGSTSYVRKLIVQ